MGIEERLRQLCQKNPMQAEALKTSANRLTSPEEMGQIYKVLQFQTAKKPTK